MSALPPNSYVHLSVEMIQSLITRLEQAGDLSPAEIDGLATLQRVYKESTDEDYQRIAEAYASGVSVDEGSLELDDYPTVSFDDEAGAYVMTWTWVASSDVDLCERCRSANDDGGGWDGLCGDCADKEHNEEEGEDDEDE